MAKKFRSVTNCGMNLAFYYKRSNLQFGDIEEEFLHAAEFGDIPGVKRLLAEYPELNIDCIDALGRTALRLSVKNEHLEVGHGARSTNIFLCFHSFNKRAFYF